MRLEFISVNAGIAYCANVNVQRLHIVSVEKYHKLFSNYYKKVIYW